MHIYTIIQKDIFYSIAWISFEFLWEIIKCEDRDGQKLQLRTDVR